MLLAEGNQPKSPNAKPSAREVYDSNYSDTWIGKFEELVPQQEIRWIIVGAGVLILLTIAFWIVTKLKGYTDYEGGSIGHLSEFEDLHERGAFSDEEMAKMRESIRSNAKANPTETNAITPAASRLQSDASNDAPSNAPKFEETDETDGNVDTNKPD